MKHDDRYFLLQPPLMTADFRCCLYRYRLRTSDYTTGYRLQATRYRPHATGHTLQATRYRPHATGYRLQATGYKLHYRPQANRVECQHVRYLVPQYHTCTRPSDGVDFLLLRRLQFLSSLPFSSQFTLKVGYSTRQPRFVFMVIPDSILPIYPPGLFNKILDAMQSFCSS